MAETKKLSLLRIKQILEEHSDIDHPLEQEEIIEYLDSEYGIEFERRAIARNISILNESGDVEIRHVQKKGGKKGGYYVARRLFTDAELRLLIDGVLSSQHVEAKKSKDLIKKICTLSNKYFKDHVKHVSSVNEWNKTENPALFLNIELIDSAINRGKQIRYEYNKFGVDRKLHHSSTSVISPYQLILHNQKYYVMGWSEYWGNMVFHRLDRITNLTVEETKAVPIRSLKGYENGVDYKTLSSCMPYMYTDKPEYIELLADTSIVDQIVDWFGKDVIFQKVSDSLIRARIKSSPLAMENWALQYLNHVEVVKPESLRNKIREDLEKQIMKYQK